LDIFWNEQHTIHNDCNKQHKRPHLPLFWICGPWYVFVGHRWEDENAEHDCRMQVRIHMGHSVVGILKNQVSVTSCRNLPWHFTASSLVFFYSAASTKSARQVDRRNYALVTLRFGNTSKCCQSVTSPIKVGCTVGDYETNPTDIPL
jgi:hypothetical protein